MRIAGVVAGFDDARGDGWLVDGDGRWYFHCVDIADGTRHIENGVAATGVRVVGLLGRDEVRTVAPKGYR